MMFAGMNPVAILVAAIAGWLAGALWYGMFGRIWIEAQGTTVEAFKARQAASKGSPASYMPFVLAFLGNLVMAWILSGLLGHIGALSVRGGIISGAFVWFGFIVTSMLVNNAFEGRSWRLTAVNAGHWLLVMIVIGAILGAWGV